ncbi:IS5 family transposase [Acinetobacter sp. TR11]|uniref:IS5 family transposase n=1 Tax=Acinetobacter sp. TR11 TaxID=3003393 RepID=UPI0022AC0C7C|nr:IS5 family transposase [Acinetobacter sp. TR11]WAU72335.1 IS5 family transposase [Acinetobacter sp. TR11]
MRYENLTRFNDEEFKRLVGVHRPLFSKMMTILENSERAKKKSGRPHSLTLEDKLLLSLNYLRSYRTQLELSVDYGIAESNVNRTIQKVENALIQSRYFALPKRNQHVANDDFVIIDVTESQIERPKKTQRKFYSGKKKKHTLKTQVIFSPKLNQIVSIQVEIGTIHDLKIARKYAKEFANFTCVLGDLAYKGLKEIKSKLLIPIKKPRKMSLPKEAKQINKEISRRRIPIEHINSRLKVFRILSERYRNRRKRFGLRVNLISGLINCMIKK